jgi:hypothetical protein
MLRGFSLSATYWQINSRYINFPQRRQNHKKLYELLVVKLYGLTSERLLPAGNGISRCTKHHKIPCSFTPPLEFAA